MRNKILMLAFFVFIMVSLDAGQIYARNSGTAVKANDDISPAAVSANDYNQRDSRWSADRLGSSKTDMYHSGCLICCIAASVKAQGGTDMTPGEWNKFCTENGVYTSDGALMWDTFAKKAQGISYSTGYTASQKDFDKLLSSGVYPIVKVKRKSGAYHWILITGAKNGEYTCMDPIDGDEDLSFYNDTVYSVREVVYKKQAGNMAKK